MKEIVEKGVVRAKGFFEEFKEFLLKYNFVSMAVGVVIGVAANDVVKDLVDSILNPLLGLLSGTYGAPTVQGWTVVVRGQEFRLGHFVASLVHFLLIALVVFLIMKVFVKVAPAEPTKVCAECLEKIPLAAKRCRACASAQPAI